MNANLPAAALGHFILKVNDMETTYKFYGKLGLRQAGIYPDLAIIELRGGTHILIFNKTEELPFSIDASRLGQRGSFLDEKFDLMIEGRSREDLASYRASLIADGLTVGEISNDKFFGHYYFEMADPDGNWITIYTSHVGDLPV